MEVDVPARKDKADSNFPLCAVSVPLAAAAQFAVPALLPVSVGLFLYTALPSLKAAYGAAVKEKRLGVDALDSVVVAGCLATGSVFTGSVLCLCRDVGQSVSRKTQRDSKNLLMSEFGKVPRSARLLREGAEIETPLDTLRPGDLIVVKAGDVVPVDGIVREGSGQLDQHVLTGAASPAEKSAGDRVFASTLMISGKVFIKVESSGADTAAAKISKILNDVADYKLLSQHSREQFSDRAVLPTLALSATALAAIGPAGAMAVLYTDFRTGIRLASPLVLLSSIVLCARRGIVIKEGRALESMVDVDTVLFDVTKTLTRDVVELGRIIARLRERGIKHVALFSSDHETRAQALAAGLEVDEYFAGMQPAEKAVCVKRLQQQGRKVCFVGEGIEDSSALQQADLSISLCGAKSAAEDAAQVVFLEPSLDKVCELRDIAQDLERNLGRSWAMIVVPNLLCVAGAFTMGFGVMASLLLNNVASLAALINGILPLRRVAEERLEQELLEDLRALYNNRGELSLQSAVVEVECAATTASDDDLNPTGETEYGTIRNEPVEVVGAAD
jgi:cation transport ATPase